MKNFFAILMIAFMSFGLSDMARAKPLKIRVKIVTGNPALGCQGHGLCKIVVEVEFKEFQPTDQGLYQESIAKEGMDGLVYLDEDNGRFSIDFITYGMDPEKLDYRLQKDDFLMEEDFQIPFNILLALGVVDKYNLTGESSYVIKKGVYPIIRKDDRITVQFDKL